MIEENKPGMFKFSQKEHVSLKLLSSLERKHDAALVFKSTEDVIQVSGADQSVIQYTTSNGAVSKNELALLPETLFNISSTVVGSNLFVAGQGKQFSLFKLNLSDKDARWKKCSIKDGLNGSKPVLVGLHSTLYLFGAGANGSATASYNPMRDTWKELMNYSSDIRGFKGVSCGNDHILFFNANQPDNIIVAYHRITNTWFELGKLPRTIVPLGAISSGTTFSIIMPESMIVGEAVLKPTKYGMIDHAVVVIFISSLVLIGVYFSKKEKSSGDFFKGGNHIPWWAAGLSMFASGAMCTAASVDATSRCPNMVVILADDLGWMDINPTAEYATGTPAKKQFYETPHLNELAKDGVSFSRCYSMPLCTPSRATILTGRNGATFGFNNAEGMRAMKWTYALVGKAPPEAYVAHDRLPGSPAKFPLQTAVGNHALPNGLADSKGLKVYSLAEMLPDYRSAFLGKWHLGANNEEGHRPQDFGFEAIAYEDEGWSKYHQGVREKWHHPGPAAQKDYLTDDLTALSVDWIRSHVDEQPEQPFLLYLAHFGVHDPFQAKPEDVTYFSTKKTRGWNGQDNPTYAGMIRSLDDSVGAIRAELKKLGVADNTIIVFASDNGGQAVKKGVRVTSNAPLRGQKAQTFEGGIRVPMMIHVPGGQRHWVDTPVSLEDVAPTLTALSGQPVPENIQNQWTGQSLVPLLQKQPTGFTKRPIYIHDPYYRVNALEEGLPFLSPNSVIIEGDYKLIASHDGTVLLFDLSKDIGEQHDLSAALPERASDMKKRLAKWRFENVPARYDTRVNPKYNPEAKDTLPALEGPLFVR